MQCCMTPSVRNGVKRMCPRRTGETPSQPQLRILQIHQRDVAPVDEESDLLVEEYRRSVVGLDHAVRDPRPHLPALEQALPQQTVSDLVPPEVRMDAHVLYPEQIVLVADVMEHLREDESDDLPILLGHEAQSAVEIRLEMPRGGGPQTVLPVLGEVLPLVLQGGREVLAYQRDLQLADLLDILDADVAELHLTSPRERPCRDSPGHRP